MVDNILQIQWHQGSEHTQYQGIKTVCHRSYDHTCISVQHNSPCSPQSHLPRTAPFRVVPCDHSPRTEVERCPLYCFSKPTKGTGGTSKGKFPMTASLFLPNEGSGHSRDVAGTLAYWRPHNKKGALLQSAKKGQDCLITCAAAACI